MVSTATPCPPLIGAFAHLPTGALALQIPEAEMGGPDSLRSSQLSRRCCPTSAPRKGQPEFFRLETNDSHVAVWWHFAFEKNFDARDGRLYTPGGEERKAAKRPRVHQEPHATVPLSTDEIGRLMNTAIELQSRALTQVQEAHWWVPILSSFLGVVVGAIIGVALKR